jgi:hypothetical protein
VIQWRVDTAADTGHRIDAMSHMVNIIDSDEEDTEPQAQQILGKPFCSSDVQNSN